tara:strand:- start:10076 stop:10183 length:108 start_codon:yes stop_codon:yes gene_type:complete
MALKVSCEKPKKLQSNRVSIIVNFFTILREMEANV